MLNTRVLEERDIRAALLHFLAADVSGNTKIQEEFRVDRGSSRIDVAVIGEALVGYEIKSDRDSFARLSNQIHAYNRIFDSVYLVVGPVHAESALDVIPSWWGLIVAEEDGGDALHLNVARLASPNTKQDPFSLASLLWKEEALAILSAETSAVPKRASSHVLWERMATLLPVQKLKCVVAEALLLRSPYSDVAVKTM